MTWEVGSQDRVSVNNGKLKSMPLKGLYMSLLANSINFIIAILFTAFVNLQALMIVMANFIEGMYAGILATPYKSIIENGEAVGVMLNKAWWVYFVIIIPALLVSTVSYYFGTKNIHFTPLLNPVNPEKEEIKRMNKLNKKK
jgi:hypothetical protein